MYHSIFTPPLPLGRPFFNSRPGSTSLAAFARAEARCVREVPWQSSCPLGLSVEVSGGAFGVDGTSPLLPRQTPGLGGKAALASDPNYRISIR